MAITFNPLGPPFDFTRSDSEIHALGDARYLKLDASNDPVTGQLDVNNILTATDS